MSADGIRLLTRNDLLALDPVDPTRRIRYGGHPDQTIDVYLPEPRGSDDSGPAPVVVLLHGGCWRAAVGREYFGAFAAALCAHGIAAWNVEYRRIGSGGGWPETFRDVADAADLLMDHAEASNLDLARVVAVGHSAGGHLAAWLAARGHLPPGAPGASSAPLRLRGVLALAGIPDLLDAHRRSICGSAVRELLGSDPDAPGSAATLAWASPAALPPSEAPHVHMVGEHDEIVPPEYVEACVARMRARGQPACLRILDGCGHFEPAIAFTPPWPEVIGAIAGLAEGRMSAAHGAPPTPGRSEKGPPS